MPYIRDLEIDGGDKTDKVKYKISKFQEKTGDNSINRPDICYLILKKPHKLKT